MRAVTLSCEWYRRTHRPHPPMFLLSSHPFFFFISPFLPFLFLLLLALLPSIVFLTSTNELLQHRVVPRRRRYLFSTLSPARRRPCLFALQTQICRKDISRLESTNWELSRSRFNMPTRRRERMSFRLNELRLRFLSRRWNNVFFRNVLKGSCLKDIPGRRV